MSVDYTTLPAFCRVAATASPTPDSAIKFEVWLPVQGWNGKFVAVGNGGFAGMIFYFAMAEPLRRGYAVAGTDTGHEGGQADASFAVGHPEKLVDFAWRAVREMTVKSKTLITAHYSVPPRRSYWVGCSSGGRQGLKEAQRFPDDFDGISAGAPANNWVPLMAYGAKVQQVITSPTGGAGSAAAGAAQTAAIAACDTRDGVTDRVVEDPRSCTFDPGTLACTPDNSSACLTPAQVEAARSIYAGVVNPRSGERIFPGPAPAGELQWGAYAPGVFPIAANYWRDLVIRDATWSPAQLDLDKDLALARSLDTAGVDATDPNLSAFAPPRKAAALARLDGRADPGTEHHRLLRQGPGDDRSRACQRLGAALHGARRRPLLRRRRDVPDRRARGHRRVGREREGARAACRRPPAGRRRQAYEASLPLSTGGPLSWPGHHRRGEQLRLRAATAAPVSERSPRGPRSGL